MTVTVNCGDLVPVSFVCCKNVQILDQGLLSSHTIHSSVIIAGTFLCSRFSSPESFCQAAFTRYSKHKVACIAAAAVHNNMGTARVRVTLKYQHFLQLVSFFAMKTAKTDAKKFWHQ